LRRGLLRSVFPVDLPYTLGGDLAGTVVARGAGVHTLAVGDRVIGRLDGGAAADFVVATPEVLVAAPTAIPLAHAAALPIAGVTAWQAVFEHANVTPGQRVFVNGSGSVGGFAIQLAVHAGAHVIATARPGRAEAVRRLGAAQTVDYATTALAEPVDVVLNFAPIDAAGVATLARPGGVVVSATTAVDDLTTMDVKAVRFVVRNDVGQLAALVKLVDAGAVRVDVAATRPLADLAAVHREAETGRLVGKTVLVPA
jgi:NADPH:quinone reductase-like Zn-dependent oxidoreductase